LKNNQTPPVRWHGKTKCILVGGECCTFITNNTTKALQGLTALSNDLAKNSGINDPLTSWPEQWVGKWKGVMTSVLTSLIVIFGEMALIGCVLYPVYEN
jgi:hypothetical protein